LQVALRLFLISVAAEEQQQDEEAFSDEEESKSVSVIVG